MRRRGVHILCGARIDALVPDAQVPGRETGITHEDIPVSRPGTETRLGGTARRRHEVPADFVLVAIGVAPTDALARASGLDCDNGILVDEYCRTSDPDIWAAGDCARHPSIHYGTRVRLESVDNAFEQGTSAALNMLGHRHRARQGAVVLVRSVRSQDGDRGTGRGA